MLYLAKLPKLPLLREGGERVLSDRNAIDRVLGKSGVGRLGLLAGSGPT